MSDTARLTDTRPETLQQHDACCELSDHISGLLQRLQPLAMPQSVRHTASLREARSHLGAAVTLLDSLLHP